MAAELEGMNLSLSVRGLCYSFTKEQPLFQDLDFDLRQGEFASLLAPSGLGKTTLFRLIAGLLAPERGTIRIFDNQAAEPVNGSVRRPGRVGYMPQRDCLMPWRNVVDNAALGLEISGIPRREAKRVVTGMLPEFGLEGAADRMPHQLSGGMRQRVSFMRSMLSGGDLLLLDEPFSALDAMTRISMQEWLLQIWEKHRKTILFITHDVDEALLLSDRLLVASAAPVSTLAEVEIRQPRPRTYKDLMNGEFIALKQQVLELLHYRLDVTERKTGAAEEEGTEGGAFRT
ncbi:ABC transporter ATP-binding protein [Paenibacillus caui]|uniref:ABC transporter ATP-binding protein n=1 Tax=Paenibacillus caui TaxID=2873927 RepID=UPI001F3D2BBC|nr:ABC transporter ATP-binding protein [Paenibacillus caui]